MISLKARFLMIENQLQKRLAYIDALRGIAVILMIEQHLGNWLWEVPWINIRAILHRHPLLLGSNALGGIGAPIFVVLAGFSVSLFVSNNPDRTRVLAFRGLVLLAIGYLLNFITPVTLIGRTAFLTARIA